MSVADARHGLRRGRRARGALEPPLVPGAGEVEAAAALELEHGGRHGLEEPAVVRDEDDGRVDRGELALEPLEAVDVEVVRRLVEQEQVGVARERAAERGARQLAAGEGRELPVEVGVAEAEPAQHRGRRGRASSTRPRARAAPAPRRSGAASRRRARRAPSPPRAAAAPARSRRGRPRPRARTRAASGRGRAAGAGRGARPSRPSASAISPPWIVVSPMIARRSVVLPAPFWPASARRWPRSTENETPSKSGSPASSLRRLDAIRDRHASSVDGAICSLVVPDGMADPRTETIDTIRALAMDAVQKANAGPSRHGDGARARRLPPLPRRACATTRPTRTGPAATASSSPPATPASSSTRRSTSPATTSRSTTCSSSGSGARARPATPSAGTRRGSRRPPARSARASRTASGWRSRSASSPIATTGPHHAIVDYLDLRDLLRRRPDGGRHPGGGLDRRAPRPRAARLRLRRQPHHDRRHDGGLVHDRGQGQALRGVRLARPARRRLRGPRRAPAAPSRPRRRRRSGRR